MALPAAAVAQPDPTEGRFALRSMTRLRRGLETSHRLAEVIARGEAAGAAADQQHAAQLPQVAAQGGYAADQSRSGVRGACCSNNQLRLIYPDLPDNFRTRLDVQWPLYTGGRLAALERGARTEAAVLVERARRGPRRPAPRDYPCALGSADGGTETVRVVDESLARTRRASC